MNNYFNRAHYLGHFTLARVALFCVALPLLSGCLPPQLPVRLYTIPYSAASSNTEAQAPSVCAGKVLGLGPLAVPPYAARPQLVQDKSDSELALLELHQWADSFEESVYRALSSDLQQLLHPSKIDRFPWDGIELPACSVSVTFQEARWKPGDRVWISGAFQLHAGSRSVSQDFQFTASLNGIEAGEAVAGYGNVVHQLATAIRSSTANSR